MVLMHNGKGQRLNRRDWNASRAQSHVQASERPFFGFIHMYLDVFGICNNVQLRLYIYFFNLAIVKRMGVKLHALTELTSIFEVNLPLSHY